MYLVGRGSINPVRAMQYLDWRVGLVFRFLVIVRRHFCPVVFTLRLESNNFLVWVTCLSLGSLVVELPPLSLWTGVFCGISSEDGGTVIPL